jgi:sulfur carrier protein ThiS/GNAT superfamily N-acetyltransferase
MPTVRAEVVGGDAHDISLDAGATYGDLLATLGFSPHEAAVLVDDAPVPEDRRIDADRVRVLRLVKGGATGGTGSEDRAAPATVRAADADDHLDVMRILDGAMLDVDAAAVRARIDAGAVLVATVDGVVGALVRDGDRVSAVAIRRRWRDRGIGTALVEAAAADRSRLVAEFDPRVRPFYESVGFAVEAVEGTTDRLRGRLER